MAYTVIIKPAAEKALRRLDAATQARISQKIQTLRDAPYPPGAKKLQSPANLWRIRVGNYRVIYTVQHSDLLVLVLDVGHRREVYR